MAYQLAAAFVDVSVRAGGLIGAFGSIKTQVNALLSGFGNVSPLLGAVAGVGSLTFAVYQFMTAAEQAFDAETRLESTIRASGNAARIAKEEIMDMSAALQQRGIFGNTEITNATTKLLQMRAITRQTFPEIIKLSTDVAAAGFGSVEHAASTLGRALADPARGLFRLRAIGIIFTKSEQQKIQALAASNNLLGAQRAILDKVKNAYGGFNEAMAKTPAGEWKKIKNDLSDIAETLGKKIYPIAVDIGRVVLKITIPVAKLLGYVLDLNISLGNWPIKLALAAVASYALAKAFQSMHASASMVYVDILKMGASLNTLLFGYLKPVSMGFVQMPGLIGKVGLALKAVQTQGIAAGLTSLLGPQAIIIAAVAAVLAYVAAVAGLYFYLQRFPIIAEMTAQFWDAVSIAVSQVWSAVGDLVAIMQELILVLMPEWLRQFPIIKAFLEGGIVPVIAYMINQLTMALIGISSLIKAISTFLRTGKWTLMEEIQATMAQMQAMSRKRFAAKPGFEGGPAAAGAGGGGVLTVSGGITGLQDAWKNVQEAMLKKEDPMERAADGIESLDGTAKSILEMLSKNELASEGAVA